jgi:curved DNA-binding protein
VEPETWARARAGAGAGRAVRARAGRTGDETAWFDLGDDFDVDVEDLFGGLFGGRGRRGGGRSPGRIKRPNWNSRVEEAYQGVRRWITVSGPDGRRSIEVTIPPGVTDGQRIRLAGQGGQGTGGAEPGDLYLIMRLAPHPRYRVEGRDLSVELRLAPWEAVLGASVAVDTPGGEAKVKVPPGTSSGRRLRLRGRGMPNPGGKPGDLYAEVRIMVPPKLTHEERRLFEQLAKVSTFDPRRER